MKIILYQCIWLICLVGVAINAEAQGKIERAQEKLGVEVEMLDIGGAIIYKIPKSEILNFSHERLLQGELNYARLFFGTYLLHTRSVPLGTLGPYSFEVLKNFLNTRRKFSTDELRERMLSFFYEKDGIKKINESLRDDLENVLETWEKENLGQSRRPNYLGDLSPAGVRARNLAVYGVSASAEPGALPNVIKRVDANVDQKEMPHSRDFRLLILIVLLSLLLGVLIGGYLVRKFGQKGGS